MMNDVINNIYEEVKRRTLSESNIYGTESWEHHLELVYKIAIKNYKKYNADYEIVALASLLHDIASVTNAEYIEKHHILGAKIAEELLSKEGVEPEKIERIKKCILNHRGSVVMEKTTPEEICISDSDAIAHFYSIPSLFRLAYVVKKLNVNEGIDFVSKKLERSYNKLSDIGKKIVKKQYEIAKNLLLKVEI